MLFRSHTREIGALIYNADYTVKYLKKYKSADATQDIMEYHDIKFLHGDRKNYVHKWLANRLDYLDSVWNLSNVWIDNADFKLDLNSTKYPATMFPDSAYCSGFNTRGTGSRTYDGRFEFDVLNNTTSLLVMSITSSAKVRVLLEPNKITTFKTMGTTAASSRSEERRVGKEC